MGLRSILLTILLFQALQGFSQLFDTTVYKRDLSYFVRAYDTETLDFKQSQEDTTMNFSHRLFNRTIETPNYINLGRIGSPELSLEPNLPNTEGFVLSRPLFTSYFYDVDSTKYFNSKTARTRLKFNQGTGNLLFLRAEHSQNIASNWNFGIDYTRTKTHNLYYNNLLDFNLERMTNLFATNAYSHYYTKNRKYEVFANFINNKNTLKETFGMDNASAFDTLSGRAKTFSAVALMPDAQNTFIERVFRVQQFFRGGERMLSINDSTTVPDSTTENIKNQWFHSLEYRRNINRFVDNDINEDVFPVRLYTLETLDSIFHSVLQNKLGRAIRVQNTFSKFWVLHEAITVKQLNAHESHLQHLQLGFNHERYLKASSIGFEGKYASVGYYAGDYKTRLYWKKKSMSYTANIEAYSIKHRPDYNDQFFGSNYYYWHTPLNKTNTLGLESTFKFKKPALEIGGVYRQIGNHVYYDTSALPQQLGATLHYSKFFISNHLKAGKFHLAHQLIYQNSSQNVMPLPALSYKASLYKEGFLFNKNMWARVGFDVTYFSEFDGYTYNPVVRQFTLSESRIGGYPMVDFFINTQVKSMLLFACIQHLTQGNFDNDAFSSVQQPIIGRALRFGIDWRLFD